jgi:hypothetical protein
MHGQYQNTIYIYHLHKKIKRLSVCKTGNFAKNKLQQDAKAAGKALISAMAHGKTWADIS